MLYHFAIYICYSFTLMLFKIEAMLAGPTAGAILGQPTQQLQVIYQVPIFLLLTNYHLNAWFW